MAAAAAAGLSLGVDASTEPPPCGKDIRVERLGTTKEYYPEFPCEFNMLGRASVVFLVGPDGHTSNITVRITTIDPADHQSCAEAVASALIQRSLFTPSAASCRYTLAIKWFR